MDVTMTVSDMRHRPVEFFPTSRDKQLVGGKQRSIARILPVARDSGTAAP
jgi:hypothetical protein